jgi:signal recognition particle subunit SEC65
MKTSEAVREVMKDKGIGVNQMADRLDKSPRLVSERLSQENISISKLREMLRVLDYKIVIVPRDCKVPDDGYEIE